jgi:hypothetical protein
MVQNQKIVLIGPSGQMCHSLEVEQYPLHTAHNGTLLVLQEEGHHLQIQTKANHMACT